MTKDEKLDCLYGQIKQYDQQLERIELLRENTYKLIDEIQDAE